MITSYYTTKLGVEPETIAYKNRVEADGGEVIDLAYVDSVYKKLKELNILSSLLHWHSAKAGIKRDINNQISRAYSLTNNGDVFQLSGTSQPIFSNNKIIYDGIDDFMQSFDSVFNYKPDKPFTFNFKGIIRNTDNIRFIGRTSVSIDCVLIGFRPTSGEVQLLLVTSAGITGFNGGNSITGLEIKDSLHDYSYTYNGANNFADGFNFLLDNVNLPQPDGSNIQSQNISTFDYNNLMLGINIGQLSKHEIITMNSFNVELTQSQITELNAL